MLAIAKKDKDIKLFFIEAKKIMLTLRDLGQLWAYCKLVDPDEAFFFRRQTWGVLTNYLMHLEEKTFLILEMEKRLKKCEWESGMLQKTH